MVQFYFDIIKLEGNKFYIDFIKNLIFIIKKSTFKCIVSSKTKGIHINIFEYFDFNANEHVNRHFIC